MRRHNNKYVGIHNDAYGGMTDTGKIIREAWVFGLIPEEETCEGWLAEGVEDLWRKVSNEWEQYGFLVSNLPDELKQKYLRIQREALARAQAAGWDPDMEMAGDED